MDLLQSRQNLEVWTDAVEEFSVSESISESTNGSPRYIAPAGMSVITKFMTPGLDIIRTKRVININLTPENTWLLTLKTNAQLTAKAIVVEIPAPQPSRGFISTFR